MTEREAIELLSEIRDSEYVKYMGIKTAVFNSEAIEAFDLAISALEKQEQDRWIPVTERLPENGRQVLVYARSVHYALAKYDEMRKADGTYKKQWVTFDAWKPFYSIKEVIAWMPLPEPYNGGSK